MELNTIIKTNKLKFSYPDKKILNGLDFTLKQGEVVSLLGKNGCGKSTFIRLLLKLIKQDSGEILLHNKEISKYSHKEISHSIAYIPQQHNVVFNYTVLEMVVMGRFSQNSLFTSVSSEDESIARDSLDVIGIAHLENNLYAHLSGGQKQMVLLARAIAQGAKTMIMDEPVSGLDYGNQIRLLELIRDLSNKGYTFLKTTHYPDHAMMVSSRVVVMDGGEIISNGKPKEVITKQMMQRIYNVDVDMFEYQNNSWCVPQF